MKLIAMMAVILSVLIAYLTDSPTEPGPTESSWGVSLGARVLDRRTPPALELAAQAGIQWLRFTMGQERVEPRRGVFDFGDYDDLVARLRTLGLRPLITLGFTPRWNSTAPPGDPDHIFFPPQDYDAFGEYVYESIRHFPDVLHWEIWNEPDLPGYWRGTPAEYARLLAVAYQAVKRANPRAQVLLGGLALGGRRVDPDFLEDILGDPRFPAARSFDVMNFHTYSPRAETQRKMDYVRSTLDRFGAGSKPIWVTETGYSSDPAAQRHTGYRGGPEAQADWLRDHLPYLRQLGAAKVFWFKLYDSGADRGAACHGLLDESLRPKPAYDAYRDVIRKQDAARRKFSGQNPFGVMLPSQLVRSSQGIQVAKALGAVYFRPSSIFLDRWNGRSLECDVALRAGLRLVLTVRNSGPSATVPPRDLSAYRRTLGQVLDTYRPAVLAVENEENSALFYTGTPEEYAAQLKAACQVAHARGIPCTNGGLVGTLVALLVYDHYRQAGQWAEAEDFAARALPPDVRRQLASPRAQEQIRKGKALLAAYRAAGVDYVNFHWYIADTRALEEAVAYLRAQTGLPVITNEIGQWTDDPNQTTAVMSKIVQLGLPIAVWFGLDGPKARGLVNLDGSLRPTGEAFQRFILSTFGR